MQTRATRNIKALVIAVFACLCFPLTMAHPMDNIAPPTIERRTLNVSQSGAIADIQDSKGKATSLIQYAFDLKSFKSNDIIINIRDKLAKALASMTQQNRQLVYNSLIKSITVNRREVYISRILFSMILKNEKAAQSTKLTSLRALFYAIVQISSQEDDLSKIITPIVNSKAYKILQKLPQEQAQVIRGVAGIKPQNRFSVLEKSHYKGLLKATMPSATMTQIFKIFEHISNQDINEYKLFIADQQKRKVFPKSIAPDDFPKVFEVFYQSKDRNYQSLVQTAFTKELINNTMSLDNILIILKAFNLVDASIQSDFIDILRTQSLLVEGMKDEDIASTLKDLSAVPVAAQEPSSIVSIYQELLTKKIINPSWAGQDVAGLIRTIFESRNKPDTYWRLGIISDLKSSKFLDSDILELYKKLLALDIPSEDFYKVALIYKQYLHNIREWDHTSVFRILNAIGPIPPQNRAVVAQQAQQSLAGRNDQTLESVIQMINQGTGQMAHIKY